jgi:3,4-dihydroxy 2-butanone 4-phosphate synthase/GTP cyclohydrolase II
MHKFNTIEELIADMRQGKMVVLVDDEDRENEGDLVLAADFVTPEKINFMIREAGGLICLALTQKQIEQLHLPLMVREDQNLTPNKTAFTVSIEAASGVTTGISAADRAHTIKVAAHPQAKPSDVHTPGHIFPIKAQKGGVLKRTGHTEGSVDLAILAGCNPAAVICEVMNVDGTMARVPDLISFALKHDIKVGTIVDLMQYRLSREVLVEEVHNAKINSSDSGEWLVRIFRNKIDDVEHVVLQKGEIIKDEEILVRVQLDSYTKDLFSYLCAGQESLKTSLNLIHRQGKGVILLLRGNNSSGNLASEVKSWVEQGGVRDMDARDFGVGAQILRQIGVSRIKLLSNRADKKVGLKAFEIEITKTISFSELREPFLGSETKIPSGFSVRHVAHEQEIKKNKDRSGDFPIQ